MGRKRIRGNTHLPPHMHKKGKHYYFVTVSKPRKWIKLSDNYPQALAKWAELEGSCGNTGLIKSAIEKYQIEVLPFQAEKTQETRSFQLIKLGNAFGHMKYDELQTHHLATYLRTRDAKVSANREVSLLSTIYRHAINWGWCTRNPCQGVIYNKETGRDRYISDGELDQLRNKADDQMKAIIDLAYLTAMRRGDILGLKLSDITDEGIFNQQGKTGKKQFFEMSPALDKVIKSARKSRKLRNITYLFTNRHGGQITATGFSSAWRRLREKAALKDITFHDIRAKSLTDAKRQGGLDYAQTLGGHANQSMTEHYIKQREVEIVKPLK